MILDVAFECLFCESIAEPVEVYENILSIACPQGCSRVLLSVVDDPNQARLNMFKYLIMEMLPNGILGDAPRNEVWTHYQSLNDALSHFNQWSHLFRIKHD